MRPVKAIRSWQEKRLRLLIPYLHANVPLYRELLDSYGVHTADLENLGDLLRLPITNKQVFSGRFVEEYTDRSVPLKGKWVKTSGTSGMPFEPLRRFGVHAPLYGDSLHYRFLYWERRWRVNIDQMRIAHIRVIPRFRRNHITISIRDFLTDRTSAVQQLINFKPDVIESHASLLGELAEYVKETNAPLRARYIVSGSENLQPATRQLIEETLRGEVYDRYGLEEVGTVGVECRAHDGFHINVESFIVEIVDDAGRPLPKDRHGRVLVTDLFNHQMPFIRYETGDFGRISWDPCRCGLTAQRLWIEGRYSTSLTVSGRRFHHFEFGLILESFMHRIMQYQIVKLNDNAIAIRILAGTLSDDDMCSVIRKKVSSLVGIGISVQVERVREIPKMPSGKSVVIVDESMC